LNVISEITTFTTFQMSDQTARTYATVLAYDKNWRLCHVPELYTDEDDDNS